MHTSRSQAHPQPDNYATTWCGRRNVRLTQRHTTGGVRGRRRRSVWPEQDRHECYGIAGWSAAEAEVFGSIGFAQRDVGPAVCAADGGEPYGRSKTVMSALA
jgi:hypothetical protein